MPIWRWDASVVVRISVDSVYGGNANAYNYPDDPINGNDLSGKCFLGLCHIAHIIAKGYHYVKKHLRKAIASSVGQLLATVLGDAIVGIISGACGEGAYVCGIVGGAVVGGLTEGLHEWADGDNHVHWVNVIVAAITSVLIEVGFSRAFGERLGGQLNGAIHRAINRVRNYL